MTARAFRQVDVFTATPFRGNPVAVVLEGDGLTPDRMQAIAAWTNLSETTFLCAPTRPEADYLLRIFTPRSELPFAGHPTLGSAHAAREHGIVPRTPGRYVQECGRGLVSVRVDGSRLAFALPRPEMRDLTAAERDELVATLRLGAASVLRAQVIDVGPVWTTVQLATADEVLALDPDLARMERAQGDGVNVFGLYPPGGDAALEVRSFAPRDGVPEDPVCGSGNGCVAALVQRDGLLPGSGYAARQGRRVGRDGHVDIQFDPDGTIWVGGEAVTGVVGVLQT